MRIIYRRSTYMHQLNLAVTYRFAKYQCRTLSRAALAFFCDLGAVCKTFDLFWPTYLFYKCELYIP